MDNPAPVVVPNILPTDSGTKKKRGRPRKEAPSVRLQAPVPHQNALGSKNGQSCLVRRESHTTQVITPGQENTGTQAHGDRTMSRLGISTAVPGLQSNLTEGQESDRELLERLLAGQVETNSRLREIEDRLDRSGNRIRQMDVKIHAGMELAKKILKHQDNAACTRLVLQAWKSPYGYLPARAKEFYQPVAEELVNTNTHLLYLVGDEEADRLVRLQVADALAMHLLPKYFQNKIRQPIVNKFSDLVVCKEGYNPVYNATVYPEVSLGAPLVDASYRLENGDSYGVLSYRQLLEDIGPSFFPTVQMLDSIYRTREPLKALTQNCLAFVEFLLIQTICGQRLNLGRKIHSLQSQELYSFLRGDIPGRQSSDVTPADVEELQADVDKILESP